MSAYEQAMKAATGNSSKVSKKEPVGNVFVKVDGQVLFTKPIWANGESKSPIQNQLNELCLDQPDVALKLFKELLKVADVEISMNGSNDSETIAGLLAALTK